ncbi:methyl-accepting chemotaxis protein [Neobacillus niacini]|uniref:methyl-accepting chemotaxis protein n=1 Tax=Neobacillus niacini TaxID=86668 RepID=UPI0028574E72|nr:methyl-accepting chemotaxis protein [Neobacillus niacini]MDR7000982.1 methyl-accepting chemotaxis protein [Neobacillus niacini]
MEQYGNTSSFKWNSARTKLIAGMTAVALIPTISIALISNQVTQNVIHDQVSRSTLQITKQASKGLDYKMEGVTNQLKLLVDNENFTGFFENKQNAKNGYTLLEDTLKSNGEYAFVYFASTEKDMLSAPNTGLPDGYDPTHQDWYKNAVKMDGKVYYSEPYPDEGTGQLVLTIAQAVKDKSGKLVGVAAIDLDMGNFSKSMKEITIGKKGYMSLIDQKGKLIYYPDAKKIGSNYMTKLALWKDVQNLNEGSSDYTLYGTEKFSSFTTNEKTGWKFVSTLDRSEIAEDAMKIRNIGWILTAIFGVLSALTAYIIGRKIARNIQTVKDALETASMGDLTARVSVKTRDEFKDLEESYNNMMDQLSISLGKVGNSSKTAMETSAHLSLMTREANASLSEVALAIDEIAKGATLQARNVNVSFEQMRELSMKLDGISTVTEDMNSFSERSMELSNKGLEQVVFLSDKSLETKSSTDEVTSIVKDVEVRMEEINTIIEAITKITDQTNLLSLNASIESARAGEHGKGFAVVANEVRKLADQSKASADEIKRIVDRIKAVVKKAVSAMEQTNQVVTEQDVAVKETQVIFNEILAAVRDLAQRVEEVQGSVKESQQNKDSVNQEMDSITAVSEQTAAATEEVAASAEQISATMNSFTEHANGLKELSEQLDDEIRKFKLK